MNDYWDPWGYNWGGAGIDDTPGFSSIWGPDLFWWYLSSYSYCYTDVEPAISFQTEAGYEYRLFEDFSWSADFNLNNWWTECYDYTWYPPARQSRNQTINGGIVFLSPRR